MGLESQQTVIRKQSGDSPATVWASYCVAHLLAKESKPFSNGEYVRKYLHA
jgi:hypothetical protein